MIIYLPIDSAFAAERRGGQQFRGWNPSWYAQAATVNALRGLQHSYILTHIDPKKSAKPKPPEPFPTPEKNPDKQAPPKPGSFAGIAASMMAASRRRKATGR